MGFRFDESLKGAGRGGGDGGITKGADAHGGADALDGGSVAGVIAAVGGATTGAAPGGGSCVAL